LPIELILTALHVGFAKTIRHAEKFFWGAECHDVGSCAVPSIAANTSQPATANVSLDAEAQQAYFDLRDSISATEGQLTECLGVLNAERLP
jgi:hypothetical protein